LAHLALSVVLSLTFNASAGSPTNAPSAGKTLTSSVSTMGSKLSPGANGTAPEDLQRPTETMCAINSQAHKRQPIKFSYQEASGQIRNAQNDILRNQPTGDLYVDCAKPVLKLKPRKSSNAPNAKVNAGGSLESMYNPATKTLLQPEVVLGAPPSKSSNTLFDPATRQLLPPTVLSKYQIYQKQ
jgi:hypothetical protein